MPAYRPRSSPWRWRASSAAATPTSSTATRGLQQRRGKRQDHAAPPGLVVRDHVGGDHRLAVAGSGGVKHPVEKRRGPSSAHTALPSALACFTRPDSGHDKTPPASAMIQPMGCLSGGGGGGAAAGPRPTPNGAALRERGVEMLRPASDIDAVRGRSGTSAVGGTRLRGPAQGHVTGSLLANCAPNAVFRNLAARRKSRRAAAPSPWSFPAACRC